MLRLSLSLTPKQLRAARPLAYGILLALTITMISRISVTSWRTTHSAGWTPAQLALMATAALSFTVGMEYYARYAHRDLWHGDALWKIHTTHHGQRNKGPFEHNDVFGVANVLVILPIMHWAQLVERSLGSAAVLGFTVGVSAFGTAYMVVHDGVVHSRFPTFGLERVGWIQEVAEAHRAHHKGKMGVPYGLFLGPHELRAAERGVPPDPMPAALKAALLGSTIVGLGALCAGPRCAKVCTSSTPPTWYHW